MDGIDAALVKFDDKLPQIIHARTIAYPAALRTALLDMAFSRYDGDPIDQLGELDREVGLAFALAANTLLADSGLNINQITAIGSHGQTIRHRPDAKNPFTLQIGDPNTIAAQTGLPVVADFRRRDMAEDGQGAPLAPAFHQAMFHSATENRAILNLGGIANLTVLPAQGEVSGFDTGPASCLLDSWCHQHTRENFDSEGKWAAQGTVNNDVLNTLLADSYFQKPPPKSTGREYFNADWLSLQLAKQPQLLPVDVQATLTEFSALSIANALTSQSSNTQCLLVCGGGVHNSHLIDRLQKHLPGIIVESTARHGFNPDYIEAAAFAWLAKATLAQQPGNLPAVTGAKRSTVLGGVYSA